MTPDQAAFLLDFLLPQLKSEQAVTTRILAAVPSERGDFQPHPKSRTARQLSSHIVLTELWFLDAVVNLQFGETVRVPADVATGVGIAHWYTNEIAQRIPAFPRLSGEHLATPVDFLGLRKDPAVAYLNILIRHSIHHRGQLSAYLRPLGAAVPAIYVESADEPFSEDAHTLPVEQHPPAF